MRKKSGEMVKADQGASSLFCKVEPIEAHLTTPRWRVSLCGADLKPELVNYAAAEIAATMVIANNHASTSIRIAIVTNPHTILVSSRSGAKLVAERWIKDYRKAQANLAAQQARKSFIVHEDGRVVEA